MSARLLVDPQTPLGDADLDGHVAGGSTRSGGTPARLLPITGDRHKGEAIDVEKGRYGPLWLCNDDNDYANSSRQSKKLVTSTRWVLVLVSILIIINTLRVCVAIAVQTALVVTGQSIFLFWLVGTCQFCTNKQSSMHTQSDSSY